MDNHLLRFQEKKFLFYDFETFNLNLHDSFNLPWQIAVKRVEVVNNNGKFYNERINKIKSVYRRSKLNHFAFHLKNPISIFMRNTCLKYLTKNEKFLESYLGKIYRN